MFNHHTPEPAPYQRDPEGRRRAMIRAAADIMMTDGGQALTHRAVAAHAGVSLGSTTKYFESLDALREAALRAISDEIETSLHDVELGLGSCENLAQHLTEAIHTFLTDPDQVRASMALTAAAASDSDLRALAVRWTDRFAEILAPHTGRRAATTLAVYFDGAAIHAAFHDRPLERASIEATVEATVFMHEPAAAPEIGGES